VLEEKKKINKIKRSMAKKQKQIKRVIKIELNYGNKRNKDKEKWKSI
jgi:hypothetical protein